MSQLLAAVQDSHSFELLIQHTPLASPVLTSSPKGTRGGVASESVICSQIGIDLMEQGGNAADAMVGTNLCVGVIGMYHSGIGGGGFLLVRDQHGRYESLDYREAAPAAAHRDMYNGSDLGSLIGGLAAGVPGELRGLEYVHKKYGVLPWATVVEPAVRVARYGWTVNQDLVRYMNATVFGKAHPLLIEDPIWAEDFAPNGTLLQLGDTITRKRYASTLEKIGKHGVDIFYEGEMAEEMVATIQATNGTMTLADFKNYKLVIKKPLSIDYRGFKVFATEAPSSGAVTLNILKTLEQFPLEDRDDTNLTTHRLVEAMKFGYGARTELGDPAYLTNLDLYQKEMLSEAKAKKIHALINDDHTLPHEVYQPDSLYTNPGHGTSHIVAADSSGLTLTSTTTVNTLFGAQIMTPNTGIIMYELTARCRNNEMDDFSIPGRKNAFGFDPSPANFIAAGKRPLSSCTPIIVEYANGTVFLATGAAGGSRIISSTTETAYRVMELGFSLHDAIAASRLHHQLDPDSLMAEANLDEGLAESLREKGHKLSLLGYGLSAVQGVLRRWDGVFEAASETRQLNSGGLTL
ncbi:gamma-glutamyltranspeptidase [Thozetella sp. PMI_491]|nr:gamma-glutamyltranspeptidase [Thozetella sp. PMI_491]